MFLLPLQKKNLLSFQQRIQRESKPNEGMDETKREDKQPSLYFMAETMHKWDILQKLSRSNMSHIETWRMAELYLQLFHDIDEQHSGIFGPVMAEWLQEGELWE